MSLVKLICLSCISSMVGIVPVSVWTSSMSIGIGVESFAAVVCCVNGVKGMLGTWGWSS